MQAIQSQRFGDYYLTAHLGRGGMADVYRARYVGAAGFQRTVVVKRILNAHNGDRESIRMFINEAKLAAELTHPNIAQIYDLGELDGELFIAMEYVRGKDLRHLLNVMASRHTAIPPAAAAYIAREICRALAHAHAHTDPDGTTSPIIHRDISPSNVVLSYDGQVKLVDFGIAKALHGNLDNPYTQAGILKGKLGYLAPEQLDGISVPQSDVFAAGIVLYEMLTVRRLIKGTNPLEMLSRVKKMTFPPPSSVVPGIPGVLDAIVLGALDRDLAIRYASAASMAKDLDLFLSTNPFSVDDLAGFMGDVYPIDVQTESDHRLSAPSQFIGTLPTRSSGSPPPVSPTELEPEINISITMPRVPVSRRKLLGAGLLGLLLLAGAGYTAMHRGEPTETAAPPTPASKPAGAIATAAAVPTVRPEAIAARGVTDDEVVFGMAAAISGPGKEYGRQMKAGIEAAFAAANDRGGVHGRRLRLVTIDDGYEPTRTVAAMQQLYEQQKVFGVIGNTGTPTAAVAVPFALERKMLFFGAYSGASLLRRDPPDRYVFNFRASYAEETAAIVKYLIKVRHVRPENIAVFAQQDAFGDAGYAGIAKAMRSLRPDVKSVFRTGYQRNTIDVGDAVSELRARPKRIRAVVLLALYRPAAKFIESVRDLYPDTIFITGSWVDSSALAEELGMLGPRYTNGVVVTQVVPSPESSATAILDYKATMARYMPAERVECISLEGYLAASVLIEGLQRSGPELDTERLVDALETIRDLDLGIGAPITFGSGEHQGSHRVWGTSLDEAGHYQPTDLE